MASVGEFARITQKIIAEEGFDDYLPTALYPVRAHIAVLEGAPDDGNLEAIALDWATKGAVGDEEFLIAFKIASTQFKVIRCHRGGREEAVFEVAL